MNNMKKMMAGCVLVLTLSAMSVMAFAATYDSPAAAAAGVTGKTVEEVTTARQGGKTYGTIAAEAGKLDEFKQAMLEIRKETLDAWVADGTLTQAEADELLQTTIDRQAVCDGTGSGLGQSGGSNGSGYGQGRGHHGGGGYGRCGGGRGQGGGGLRNGSCRNW